MTNLQSSVFNMPEMSLAKAVVLFTLTFVTISSAYTVVPSYQLNDGRNIPAIGLGTWFGVHNKTHEVIPVPEETELAVGWAIEAGYRLFDTAAVYGTEEPIGKVVQRKIAEGVVKREDIFIVTKLWNDAHARDAVIPALRESLNSLSMEYVDLYLIHFPIVKFENGTFDPTDYVETWEGMIEAKSLGLARSIGLSNFNEQMIERIIKNTCVKPAVAQFELNLQIQQPSLRQFCLENNVTMMAYTPFGSIFYEKAPPGAPPPRVDDPVLVQIANTHNKTVPQIVLRYLIGLGAIPIPKSTNKSRIEENIRVFDFDLSPEEKTLLAGFDANYRTSQVWTDSPYYLTSNLEYA